ncbi:hypothetical protein U2069_14870, partial [Listeria monocytogenes]|uniref:hypothetical protein n=1 Tax=Listeria monocytogenes TaxID=1639 RepID=UPI002FDBDC70
MKRLFIVAITLLAFASCDNIKENRTSILEQAETEQNQSNLLSVQPPPKISWSLERDNLIK